MTKQEAIEFGKYSAQIGFDQNQVEDYKDNVRDTLTDEKSSEWEFDAILAFDIELEKLKAK